MNNAVNPKLYRITQYSGNGINKRIELTDEGIELVCKVAFQGQFKTLNAEAIRLLLALPKDEAVNAIKYTTTSCGLNQLLDPWKMANPAAVLWPEDFQPHERKDEVFFEMATYKKEAGIWISATHFAVQAANAITEEANKLANRIRQNLDDSEYLPFLVF